MQGIVLHCANQECKKLLMKEAYLAIGTKFKFKCYWCGHTIEIKSEPKRITMKDLSQKIDNPMTLI